MPAIADLARDIRRLPGVLTKADIGLVADVLGGGDWLFGPGDDGAVVTAGSERVVAGGEAILPSFVAADPFGAGVAAVLANVNDLAAMGARPLALLDTFVGPREVATQALRGMRWASDLYDVPIVGGHLTITDAAPALSAVGIGKLDDDALPLSARHAAPGQALVLGCCLDGTMRTDFTFFRSFDERGKQLADDVRLLADLAASRIAAAAKDVSMAGLVGSLAMLLEPCQLGMTLNLETFPTPQGVTVSDWLRCFPCYAFLVTTNAAAECVAAFEGRGLTARDLGSIDDTGLIRLRAGHEVATVFDLRHEGVTNLRRD